jgi:hypothetical protein
MMPLTFRMPERGIELTVGLNDATFRPLLGELRIVSPLLATKIEDVAVDAGDHVVELDERETTFLASAAATLLRSPLVDDPELEQIAEL